MASMIIRGSGPAVTYVGDMTNRETNMKFVFLTEFSGFLAWVGCVTALINEGQRHKGRFDRKAKTLVFFEFVEV